MIITILTCIVGIIGAAYFIVIAYLISKFLSYDLLYEYFSLYEYILKCKEILTNHEYYWFPPMNPNYSIFGKILFTIIWILILLIPTIIAFILGFIIWAFYKIVKKLCYK